MPQRFSVAVWLIIVTSAGCATPGYDPFQIPRNEFRAKVKTIALAGPYVREIDSPGAARAKFSALIEAKLRSQGFETVAWEEHDTIWEQLEADVGGFFDPHTGSVDEEKLGAARKHMLNELRTQCDADALLHATLAVMPASFQDGDAHWCGASQNVKTGGRHLVELLTGATRGSVQATALFVVIEDMSGVDMYKDCGGIEVMARLAAGGFEEIPPDELFKDSERNRAAVGLALDSLTGEGAAGK